MAATAARLRAQEVAPLQRARTADTRQPAAEPSRFQRRAEGTLQASRAGSAFASSLARLSPQRAARVSLPGDAAEREAEATAGRVVRMPDRAARPAVARRMAVGPSYRAPPSAAAGAGVAPARISQLPGRLVQRAAAHAPPDQPDVMQEIEASATSGAPLPADVRAFMEPRFRADFGDVRVHTDATAQRLSARLSARAFTYRSHIFFGRGQYRPDTAEGAELIAHELTHTIQQQAAVQRAAQPAQPVEVAERAPASVQRLGLSDILDGLAELAANVPGFTLLTLIIGRNPINLRVVERSAVNLLRAFMGLIPGGEILFQVLDRYGVVRRLGDWVSAQSDALGLSFQSIREAFGRFTDSLGIGDLFSPSDVWRRAQSIFTPFITRIRNFVSGLVTQAIAWLKETFLQPLSDFCREIPGYGLIKVMLGRDPFTNAPVERSPLNVVRGVAEFIPDGTQKVDQLVQSRALDRAYQWFIAETTARNLTWTRVTGTFTTAWNSLRLEDVLHPIDTLQRMIGLFRPLLSDLVGFAGAALMKLLELIYEAAMGAGGARILAIIKRVRSTFTIIINDPVGFLRNLLGAVGQGVRQFMANILRHLRDGVIAWLAGPVARSGIQIPAQWDLRGIIWFVLQILGLTWARVREKLVRLMGERPVAMLEGGFQLLQEIRERGLVQALRERVTEFFGDLREAALGAIRSFIQQRLVMAGITQLLSLLSPVGAVIQAIIKTYTTIQFFIQRINQILDLVESVVNSIAAIASGAIAAAAGFVERTMARTIPVILDFLARFIGLGDVGGQVQSTIRGLQARVDRMLDRAVDWIRRQAATLASRVLGGNPSASPQQRLVTGLREGVQAVNRLSGSRIGLAVIRPVLAVIRVRHAMRSLDAVPQAGRWAVAAAVNPAATDLTEKLVDTTTPGATRREYSGVNAGGFGSGARVAGLTVIGAQNSPSATSATWTRLLKRLNRPGGSTYYVAGHLINGTFGGPGSDWRNLTPLTQAANNRSIASMLRTFETPVRDAVRGSTPGSADLTVTITYGRTARSADAQRARTELLPLARGAAIAQLIEDETQVPRAVAASATITTGTGAVRTITSTTQNAIDSDLTRYYHADHPTGAASDGTHIVNLNSASRPELLALHGMTAALAARIESNRSFRDRDDFVAKLDIATWHSLVSTAGVSLRF